SSFRMLGSLRPETCKETVAHPEVSMRFLVLFVAIAALAGCSGAHHPTDPAPGGSHGQLGGGIVVNEDFTGRQVFPSSNWWNLDGRQAPVDTSSQAIIDWISGRTPQNPTATRQLHPDFGPPPYGMPYIGVSSTQPLEIVAFSPYGSQSDAGAPGSPPG